VALSNLIFFSVLLGALLHASWNAIVKSSADKMLEIALVCTAGGLLSLVPLPFLPAPDVASWPYMLASTVLECAYFILLATAYRAGDMSTIYPLMRGTAPALVAIIGASVLGEHLPARGWLAILAICAGIISLLFNAQSLRSGHRGAVGLALANSIVIAGYTMIDGIGVRKSGSPVAYALCISVLTAIPLLVWAIARHRKTFISYARARAGMAFAGGAATTASYGLALIAMTHAPIALVAALRETSILFATAISTLVLREHEGWTRWGASGLIAAGAVSIKLA
jgi:drug/metabolite transporter (DMT)-like permease